MKFLLLSTSIISALYQPAFAQSHNENICNSPLVMFGPVVSVCEAVGAEVPDTELTGLFGGGRITRDRSQIIDAFAGEMLREDPSPERLLNNLTSAPAFSSGQAPVASFSQPTPEHANHPCDVDPTSFACEFQHIVDDVNAQNVSNF